MFVLGKDPGTKVDAPCIAWLIEGPKGEKVLVDTGPHASDAPTARYHTRLIQEPEQRLDRALRGAGVDPAEIDAVVFTHLHWDHTHNAGLLANAHYYVQRAELMYAVDPIAWHRGSFESGLPEGNPPWMEVFHRLRLVEGDTEILPGLGYHLLPGHTPGSAGLTVSTSKGVYMLAGDTVPMVENWEGNQKQSHIPSALLTNTIDYYHSFQKIERLAERILPSHDARALDQHVYP